MTNHEAQADNDEPQIVDVTITAPDAEWLRRHCAMLIERRLAASANIIPAIDSIYRWQGEVHSASEALAILHTQRACLGDITRLTVENHAYEVVHILANGLIGGNRDYLSWIADSTS